MRFWGTKRIEKSMMIWEWKWTFMRGPLSGNRISTRLALMARWRGPKWIMLIFRAGSKCSLSRNIRDKRLVEPLINIKEVRATRRALMTGPRSKLRPAGRGNSLKKGESKVKITEHMMPGQGHRPVTRPWHSSFLAVPPFSSLTFLFLAARFETIKGLSIPTQRNRQQ